MMESVRRQYPRCTSIALDDQLQWQMLQQHAMHVSVSPVMISHTYTPVHHSRDATSQIYTPCILNASPL